MVFPIFLNLFPLDSNFLRCQILHRSMVGTFPLSQNKKSSHNVGKHHRDAWQVGPCSSCGLQVGKLLGELAI